MRQLLESGLWNRTDIDASLHKKMFAVEDILVLLLPVYMCTVDRAGIFEYSMGAGNRVGIGCSYRPARLHRLAELIPLHRFKGFFRKFKNTVSVQ